MASPGRNLKLGPPEYEARELPTRMGRSVIPPTEDVAKPLGMGYVTLLQYLVFKPLVPFKNKL